MDVKEPTEQDIRDSFAMYDTDRNGSISTVELREVFINLGEKVTNEEIDQIIKVVDTDGNKAIDYEEFVEIRTQIKKNNGNQDMREAFAVFDHRYISVKVPQ